MTKEDIHWDNWHRILVGAAPTEFLIEVLFRTPIMYLALLIILRLMGKRMGGVITIAELSVMVTRGAIICVPMQIPDKSILQGVLALICALAFLHLVFPYYLLKMNLNLPPIIELDTLRWKKRLDKPSNRTIARYLTAA